ncbi:hypothetical protein [Streptomyces shaanxiensis]
MYATPAAYSSSATIAVAAFLVSLRRVVRALSFPLHRVTSIA